MATQPEDFKMGVAQGLSGVNVANMIGGGDTLWSGNATVTLVQAAVIALAPVAGGSDDLKLKINQSLRNGVNSGAMPETHAVTTVAGARALFTAADPTLPSTFSGSLAQ